MRRAEVRITGRVQGVFFRAELRDRARSLGVGGSVRNAPDGSVEAVLEGDDDAVESLLRWCEQGPAGARVEDVSVTWGDPRGERGFQVSP